MKNKPWIILAGMAALAAAAWFGTSCSGKPSDRQHFEMVRPEMGNIRNTVSATGVVMPQNRLEIKPPIAGRIDAILVQEGDTVAPGQTLASMSSTDRAALLDAARPQGKAEMNYWNQVYKSTPILSPINGTVIVRAVEPGQTVSAGETVLVLSDRLIVQAQVDETDIGKVKLGQKAIITLDAYPEIHVEAKVDHIAYESTVVNNVTIYQIDILPKTMPPLFRSGMSANVDIVTVEKKQVLILALDAVRQESGSPYVLLKGERGEKPRRRDVNLGLADDKNVEVISGVAPENEILVDLPDYSALDKAAKTNPFMPKRPGAGRNQRR